MRLGMVWNVVRQLSGRAGRMRTHADVSIRKAEWKALFLLQTHLSSTVQESLTICE